MRLEIGAGAAAGRAGGVLWSSAILAAISPLRAAFTSRLSGARPLRCARPVPAASRHSRLHSFFSPPRLPRSLLVCPSACLSLCASVSVSPMPLGSLCLPPSLAGRSSSLPSGLVLIPSGSPSVCLSVSLWVSESMACPVCSSAICQRLLLSLFCL